MWVCLSVCLPVYTCTLVYVNYSILIASMEQQTCECVVVLIFQIQEQAIIDDIMDLEDKFADTLGPIPYFDSSAAAAAGMIVPQTVSFAQTMLC